MGEDMNGDHPLHGLGQVGLGHVFFPELLIRLGCLSQTSDYLRGRASRLVVQCSRVRMLPGGGLEQRDETACNWAVV